MEDLESLVDKLNKIYFAGGNVSNIWKKISETIREVGKDQPFCLLSQRRVMAIIASLDEISQIFMATTTVDQGVSLEKFLNCKGDIYTILALGTIQARGPYR